MWNKEALTYFKVLSQHSHGVTEKKLQKLRTPVPPEQAEMLTLYLAASAQF
jgi:hypothetical protein